MPGIELMTCPNLAVPREVMHHVVQVESSYNPYAIGVVGGRLVRQPRNLPEAVSTARMLEQHGYNFSLGLAQVNRYNLEKYGLESYEKAFQTCANLQAGSRILAECYQRSRDWGKSFSCYYSGDFKTGYRHGYVQKVYASMRRSGDSQIPSLAPIQVIDRSARRVSSVRTSTDANPERSTLAERRGARPAATIGHAAASPPSDAHQGAEQAVSPWPGASQAAAAAVSGVAIPTSLVRSSVKLARTPADVGEHLPVPTQVAPAGDSAFVF